MLLPVRTGLTPSAVFRSLNKLMREVVFASCAGRAIDDLTLPYGLLVAAQENPDTNTRMQALYAVITALDDEDRYQLYLGAVAASSVRNLFTDPLSVILEVPEVVSSELKKLAAHLFKSSSTLVGITKACGETVKDHYNRYSALPPPGNGNICGMCATEQLAQRRNGVNADDQWRAPYDHLLAKDKYPQFGIDPDNLLPICHTCNSKAKLAKDLLHNQAGQRRACFDPWSEHAHGQVALKIDFQDISPVVIFDMTPLDITTEGKLETWNEVYQIKQRIEGEFQSLYEKLTEDLNLRNITTFKQSLEEKSALRINNARLTPNNYWRGLLYSSLLCLPDHSLEQLRTLCHENFTQNSAATYGVF